MPDLDIIERADLARVSVSCDGFPQRHREGRQCGACSSCVLRRQALWSAGLPDPSEDYRIDLFADGASLARPGTLEMVDQVARLKLALAARDPWSGLLRRFPELLETEASLAASVGETQAREKLLDLYRRYTGEWDEFPPARNLLRAA